MEDVKTFVAGLDLEGIKTQVAGLFNSLEEKDYDLQEFKDNLKLKLDTIDDRLSGILSYVDEISEQASSVRENTSEIEEIIQDIYSILEV